MDRESQVKSYFLACASLMSAEGASQVQHYLDHGEYEMAFEGMVLELASANRWPANFSFDGWIQLARDFGLHEESVFDGGFWTKLQDWGHRGTQSQR